MMTGLPIEKTRENIVLRLSFVTDFRELDSIVDDALEVIPGNDTEFWNRLEELGENLL